MHETQGKIVDSELVSEQTHAKNSYDILAQLMGKHGLSLAYISQRTNISKRQLEHIRDKSNSGKRSLAPLETLLAEYETREELTLPIIEEQVSLAAQLRSSSTIHDSLFEEAYALLNNGKKPPFNFPEEGKEYIVSSAIAKQQLREERRKTSVQNARYIHVLHDASLPALVFYAFKKIHAVFLSPHETTQAPKQIETPRYKMIPSPHHINSEVQKQENTSHMYSELDSIRGIF